MAVDPSALSGPLAVDPNAQMSNAQAESMIKASAMGYGVMPDPQLVTESMLTGSQPIMTSAFGSGDPNLAHEILSQPIGQSAFNKRGVSPPTSLYHDPYTFNQADYQQQMSHYKQMGITVGFESMKSLPIANLGWFNSVTSGDASTVRTWQQFLADKGYYGSHDGNGANFKKGETNGYTSPQFEDALKQWSLAYFAPMALYSKDPQEMRNAQQYLNGLGYDITALAGTMARDPKQREQVVDSWLQAQGPDTNGIKALNHWSDMFGAQTLPDQLNKLRGDDAWSNVGDAIHHIVPFIGSDDQQKLAHLTEAEKEVLSPALQQAHDSTGFLGFMGDVLTAPSKAAVTVGYFFKDAVTGQKENINPFDSTSSVSQFVQNPMRVMFGEQFVKEHPWLAFMGNTLVNIGDDPLSYIPFVGSTKLAETLGESVSGAEKMTAAEKAAAGKELMTPIERSTGGLISHRVGATRYQFLKPTTVVRSLKDRNLAATLTKALDPIGSAQQELANAMTKSSLTLGTARRVLGGNLDDPKTAEAYDKLMTLAKNGDPNLVLSFIRDPANGFAHRLVTPDLLMNHRSYGKIMENFDKVKDGQALSLWRMHSMQDSRNVAHLTDDPAAMEESMVNAAMSAGVGWEEIDKFSTEFWKAGQAGPFQRRAQVDMFNQTIEQALDKKLGPGGLQRFQAWKDAVAPDTRQGTLFAAKEDPLADGPPVFKNDVTRPDGTVMTAKAMNQEMGQIFANRSSAMRQWESMVDAQARKDNPVGRITPEMRQAAAEHGELANDKAAYRQAVNTFNDHINNYEDMWSGVKGSSARANALPPRKTSEWGLVQHSAADIMAYTHPTLRKMEMVQHQLGMDKMMSMWKQLVLSKPATSLRVVLGDESSRFHINLLLNDPATWLEYVKHSVKYHGKALEEQLSTLPPEIMPNITAMMVAQRGLHPIVPAIAGQVGYGESLTNLVEKNYSAQWSKDWANATHATVGTKKNADKAGKDAIRKALLAKTEEGDVLRKSLGITSTDAKNPWLNEVVETKHYELQQFTRFDPAQEDRQHLLNWIKDGKVDRATLKRLEKADPKTPDHVLPFVQLRPDFFHNNSNGMLGHALDWYHSNITNAWVTKARGRGFMFKKQSELGRLEKFYGKNNQYGHDLDAMATHQATDWVKRNTYQGARSVLASSLRSVAPFWGASANSNRFYLHTLIEHPELAHPVYNAEQGITEEQKQGGLHLQVPFMGQVLSKFGLASGDQFSFDPFNAMFLTREGFGGFVPGMGPVFNASMGVVGHFDPSLRESLGQLPGMEYGAKDSPILPWLEDLSAGVPMAFGGTPMSIPLLAERNPEYYNKLIDQKLQQLEATWQQEGRKGQAPTVEDARHDLGLQRIISGAAGFAAPVGVSAGDEKRAAIQNIEKQWDPNLSEADKQSLLTQHPEVADYFKYNDPNTPLQPTGSGQESKQDILARSPWVLSYSTGTGQSNVPGRVTVADTQKQYQNDVQTGDISTLTPTQYLQKVRNQEEMTQAWNVYDRLHAAYQEYLQTSGVASSSQMAKDWRRLNYDPQIHSLAKTYKNWGDQFIRQVSQDTTGKELASMPFHTVSTFQVLPQNPELETKATTLWRAALIRRDQAESALQQVIVGGGSQAEKDLILQGLAQQLDSLAQQDPTFARQLSRYKYSTISDLITSRATIGASAAS